MTATREQTVVEIPRAAEGLKGGCCTKRSTRWTRLPLGPCYILVAVVVTLLFFVVTKDWPGGKRVHWAAWGVNFVVGG